MTIGRVCTLLTAFVLIALAVVHLRAEQTRCAARTLAIESKCIEQRRELWRLQASVARLQAPSRVHDCMDWYRADLVPPQADRWWHVGTRVAFSGSYE